MTVVAFKIIWEFYVIKSLLLQRSKNCCVLHAFFLSFILNINAKICTKNCFVCACDQSGRWINSLN